MNERNLNVLNVDAGAGNFVLNNVANVLNKVKNAANNVAN